MLRKQDAVIGKRVKWQSLDQTIPATFGTVIAINEDREVIIEYDDGEEGSTYIDSGVSTVYPA